MGLREDVEKGLEQLSGDPRRPLRLDADGRCDIPVPMPASVVELVGGQLHVTLLVPLGERYFTFLAPVATMGAEPSREFLEALLIEQARAPLLSGASVAINAEEKALLAVYHWMLDSISPEQFVSLFQKFCVAALDILDRIGDMARYEPTLRTIHGGTSE